MRAPTQTFGRYFQTLVEENIPHHEALGAPPSESQHRATGQTAALLLATILNRKAQALVRKADRWFYGHSHATTEEYLRQSERYATEAENPALVLASAPAVTSAPAVDGASLMPCFAHGVIVAPSADAGVADAGVFREWLEHIVGTIADAPKTLSLRQQRQFVQALRQWSRDEVNARLTQAFQA